MIMRQSISLSVLSCRSCWCSQHCLKYNMRSEYVCIQCMFLETSNVHKSSTNTCVMIVMSVVERHMNPVSLTSHRSTWPFLYILPYHVLSYHVQLKKIFIAPDHSMGSVDVWIHCMYLNYVILLLPHNLWYISSITTCNYIPWKLLFGCEA